MEDEIRRFLKSKIDQGSYTAASVYFGKRNKILARVHEGALSSSSNILVNESTAFDLQSITKALSTSILTLILCDQNRITLDSEIDRFLPKHFPQHLAQKGITFKHLLTHSSGLSDSDLEGKFSTAFELWHSMFSAPLRFNPGSSVEYTDLGFRILGKILEIILDENVERASDRLVFRPCDAKGLSYSVHDQFNLAGCPDAHGVIDDEQVRFLGGILGCDGLFGSAFSIYKLMAHLLSSSTFFGQTLGETLSEHISDAGLPVASFFDALAVGPKSLGWEVNPRDYSYAGHFNSPTCFEKAGGAGTFIWFDEATDYVFVYLTNHGKPKPFTMHSWNALVDDAAPHVLSNLIYASI